MYLFIVEEHHEAYWVWHYAVKEGIVDKNEFRALVHLDEHSDMSAPKLNMPIDKVSQDEIECFTYNELTIASFIVPAIYKGLFNQMFWIKQRHGGSTDRANKLYVRTREGNGKEFIVGKMDLLNKLDDPITGTDIVQFEYYKKHIDQLESLTGVFLDIDLDYFSCNVNPLLNKLSIEITKEEFDSFKSNKYHRLNFFDFGRIEAVKSGDKYFYNLNNYSDQFKSPLKVDSDEISLRIKNTIEQLSKKIKPQIITVCRSNYSGYTPADQLHEIEDQLLNGLRKIYEIERVVHISELKNIEALIV